MKHFLKFTLASMVGFLIASIVLFVLVLVIIAGTFSMSKTEYIPVPKSILHLKLEGALMDRTQDDPFEILWGTYSDTEVKIGLDKIQDAIKTAKENSDFEGIYISCGFFSASLASVEEIRNALIDFKKSGKFIISYGGGTFLQNAYYLTSLSDRIIMNPQGLLFFNGLSAETIFIKQLLEKTGIDIQIFKVGEYKSATEIFSNNKMSDYSRKEISDYLNISWKVMLDNISAERKIPVDSLQAYADRLLAFQPAEISVKCGLIDTLMYENDVIELLKNEAGISSSNDIILASVNKVASIQTKSAAKDKIAVVYALNGIDDGSSDGVNSAKLIKDLKTIQKNDKIKAVVLRVNSPGGSAYGSEQIWKELTDMKAVKPVVVSMGDYAASGGYYISSSANYIFAHPTTLTGSIGIFGILPDFSGLLDKIGLSFDQVTTGKFSDMPNVIRPMTAEEKAVMQAYLENGYALFLSRCVEGRNMPLDSVKAVAQGRIWSGVDALNAGLIDELGGLNDALKKAAELSNTGDYSIVYYPKEKDIFTLLMEDFGKSSNERFLETNLGENYKHYKFLKQIRSTPFMQARIPFEVSVN
ncbi:MAG: signal peptide peptidase SppA [Bacteroidales bacterium]|jgi:protease-4|nr:signal peptide peptidase SppA [Bacteroidales bacterium]